MNYVYLSTAIKGAAVLLPILGVTWIVGVFAVDANTTVFIWIFTIINSLQVLNKKNNNNHKKLNNLLFFFLGSGDSIHSCAQNSDRMFMFL